MTVTLQRRGAVATIELNRPDAMNAWNREFGEELRTVVERTAADADVRAVVITGAGRAFSAGADLKDTGFNLTPEGHPDVRQALTERYHPIITGIREMPKPVIAAVNGVAAGAGASLAFACDLRIMATSAGFNLAFPGVALSCDTGASWTLQRLVGRAKAIELLYFPSTIAAQDALALGLATRVVPDEELAAEVAALAGKLASGPTLSYASMRQSVNYAASHDFASSLAFEGEKMNLTGASADHRRAVDAFLAKEKPSFEGR